MMSQTDSQHPLLCQARYRSGEGVGDILLQGRKFPCGLRKECCACQRIQGCHSS